MYINASKVAKSHLNTKDVFFIPCCDWNFFLIASNFFIRKSYFSWLNEKLDETPLFTTKYSRMKNHFQIKCIFRPSFYFFDC